MGVSPELCLGLALFLSCPSIEGASFSLSPPPQIAPAPQPTSARFRQSHPTPHALHPFLKHLLPPPAGGDQHRKQYPGSRGRPTQVGRGRTRSRLHRLDLRRRLEEGRSGTPRPLDIATALIDLCDPLALSHSPGTLRVVPCMVYAIHAWRSSFLKSKALKGFPRPMCGACTASSKRNPGSHTRSNTARAHGLSHCARERACA